MLTLSTNGFACWWRVAVLCLCTATWAAAQGSAHVEMLPQEVVGVVLYPDGRTPVAELPVRVWSGREGRIVHRSMTDANGNFRIPFTASGDCLLFVGRLRIDLRFMEGRGELLTQRHDMVMVLPRRMMITGGRMFDVVISPVLAAAAAEGVRDGGERRRLRPPPALPNPSPGAPPPLPSEPPVVSP